MQPDITDPVVLVRNAVARELTAHVAQDAPVAVALSGGRDSIALLDALAATAGAHRVHAIHVHHGLSPNASRWQRFCEALCAARGIGFSARHVTVAAGADAGLEAQARRVRYAALADAAREQRIRHVALAHHRDDQAETLLLQLLRGAGPHGLAGMSVLREDARGVAWWRPLLAVPRSAIDAYVGALALDYVDDESNARTRHRRNAVRQVAMPALREVAPGAPATLARAAAHQAEAALLADDLARIDAAQSIADGALDRASLAALPAHRARNLLRWFLRECGLPAPSSARLAQMLAQLCAARGDARIRLAHAGAEVGVHRGRIRVHAPPPLPFAMPWRIDADLVLAHGRLTSERADGEGLDLARVAGAMLTVRSRRGGERLSLGRNRPHRALKVILQDAGVAPWDRVALPLVYCGDALIAVPGVGVAAEWQCEPGAKGVIIRWRPAPLPLHASFLSEDKP
jgi:tRNA(Ile)-lysidine synthase